MKRRLFSLVSSAALLAGLLVAGIAGPAAADIGAGCNGGQLPNFGSDPQLTATISVVDGSTDSYALGTTNEGASGGIPGLIEYCVYVTPSPDSVTTDSQIGNLGWTDPANIDGFSWGRPDGNPSNLPFDGTTYQMGTATWAAGAPSEQVVLLHINDATACAAANQASQTCFVHATGGGTCDVGCGGGQGLALTIDKSASGAYDTTYGWTVTKAVDKTKVEQIGGSATFNYTVTASYDTGTDGKETVSGTITVTNLNADSVTADVTDHLTDAASTACTVTGGAGATLPTGDTPFDYTCPAVALGLTMQNTGTVTWDGQVLSPSGDILDAGDASATVDIDPVTQSFKNTCNDVTDTFNGGSAVELGNVCVGNSPAASYLNPTSLANFSETFSAPTFTFKYSRSIAVPAHDCVSYTNTAYVSSNTVGASKTVTVCGPANTGALTIGFWKTTNGQNLIGTYCGATATGLGNYLEHLGGGLTGPFSNAPTSCSSLKTYVYSILNGANAKDMNSMLRAQMLGAALDVWFSGPGWTSTTLNKVKAPSSFLSHNNLGTFNMDATAVCPMVDNLSTGTATCKNNTPSTDAVAAGAVPSSPMAMQAILDFAATAPSPFNGSTSASNWYAGNKTKEEILKNIFDQFNNGDAFGSF